MLIGSLAAMAQTATINGKIEGYRQTDTLQVYVSGKSSIDMVDIKADGTFTITESPAGPAEAMFFLTGRGQLPRDLTCAALLTPGQTIGMNISFTVPDSEGKVHLAATFSGDDAAKPTYANQFYTTLRMGNSLSGENLADAGSFTACKKRVDDILAPLYKTLSGVKDAGFVTQARQALDSQKDAAYFAYANAAEEKGQKMEADADFMKMVNAINFDDTLQMSKIQSYMQWYSTAHPDAYMPLTGEAAQLKHFATKTQNADVRNKMVEAFISAINLYAALGISAARPEFKELYEQLLPICTNETYTQFIKEQLAKMENSSEGKPAVNFTIEDTEGKTLEFESIAKGGTVTYVDFWATWCGPCKREIPYLATMVDELKDTKQIRIISISIDEDHEAWRKMVAADKPAWEQYIIPNLETSAAIKEYDINSIPRFMIFDKEGNLYKSSATRPSDASTKSLLLELAK